MLHADQFAESWKEMSGASAIEVLRQEVFSLGKVEDPTPVAGRIRAG